MTSTAGAIAAEDKRALKELTRRSDAKGLAQLGLHLLVLAGTGGLVWLARGSAALPLAWLAHGIVLAFLFAPLHECMHRTAFRTRWLNDAVAWICALPLLLPPTYFRAFHMAHHRWTQDPERDPELMMPKPRTRRAYLWQVSGLPFWGERIATTLRQAAGRVDSPFLSARDTPAVVREARILLAVLAGLAASLVWPGSWAFAVYLAVPAVLGQPFLRAFLLAEHSGCPFVPDMLRNSRTTLSNALVRRLAWNAPYHAEHHAHPAIPFHALPAAHRHLRARIAVQADGYVEVHRDLLADLR